MSISIISSDKYLGIFSDAARISTSGGVRFGDKNWNRKQDAVLFSELHPPTVHQPRRSRAHTTPANPPKGKTLHAHLPVNDLTSGARRQLSTIGRVQPRYKQRGDSQVVTPLLHVGASRARPGSQHQHTLFPIPRIFFSPGSSCARSGDVVAFILGSMGQIWGPSPRVV
ncbi:hypothetical protein CC80DRAFT_556951 [Byssothecium circinans]|uniref:Uncharacterized protein n=1 Tax=Byssothecium circinans TaxID=147558 RepID=A0A6A5UF72_9PLEO|nr:hypothetical protein CC80DRAFT_556951 [Byssothecium circinans]